MKKFLSYFVPYVPWCVVLVGFVYGQTQVTLSLPDYMAHIVDKGIVVGNSNYILTTGLWMLMITLIGGLCTVGVSLAASKIGAGFVRRLRSALFAKVEYFSLADFNTFSTASLITRATNDMQQLQQTIVLLLRMALVAPFMGVGAIIKAYALSPHMSWIMAVSIGALVVVIVMLFSIAVPKFKLIQQMVDRLGLVIREMLTGIRVIRSFHKEKSEEERFDGVNMESYRLNLFVNRVMIVMQPVMMLIMSFTSLAIIWIGAKYVDNSSIQLGSLLAFMQYAIQAVSSFLMLSFIFFLVPRAMVSANRISEVLNSDASIIDPKKPKPIPAGGGEITFNHVTFRYDEAADPVLKDISFTAKPGEITAIVGGTGSGKSTLVNLIPRLYDVSEGSVRINGVDVREATQQAVHAHIGYATQKATVFSGTVKSNIAYGSEPSDKEIKHAAAVAQAADFIEAMPKKYNEKVARGGTNLSGGQKQRLSLARAVARKPDVYLFDETFSALDAQTDARARAALARETTGKTMIIVEQRISAVMQADQILVIDDGEIVARGKHEDLLQTSKVYREIAESQLTAKELEENS